MKHWLEGKKTHLPSQKNEYKPKCNSTFRRLLIHGSTPVTEICKNCLRTIEAEIQKDIKTINGTVYVGKNA
jgi:hypothetical protein